MAGSAQTVITVAMRFTAPRPLDDHAWRTSEGTPGVAHFYGWSGNPTATSRCWAEVSFEGTRQASEDDRLCPDCEASYWEREAVLSTGVDGDALVTGPLSERRVSGAARTNPDAPWVPD